MTTLRSSQACAILTALGLSVGFMSGVAEAAPPREHSCPSPFFPNSDLNERYGVNERIIGPPGCRQAFAGEQWVRAVPPWITAEDDRTAGYPSEYVPDLPNPIDDFNAKFKGARYVIDAGTAQEKTVTAGPEILRKGFEVPEDLPGFGGLPFSSPVSPVFHPLSVGNHTINVFVTMSARHCNGLTPVPRAALGLGPAPAPDGTPGAACLPAGDSRYPVVDNGQGNPAVGLAFTVSSQPPPTPQAGR
jgi:hypothetical protein